MSEFQLSIGNPNYLPIMLRLQSYYGDDLIRVNPVDISSYQKNLGNDDCVNIYMKNGIQHLIRGTVEDIDDKLKWTGVAFK